MESVKAVSDLYMPVSGKVKEVNKELENQPELINQSPHEEGWIITIELAEDEDLSNLMSAEEYDEFLNEVAGPTKKKKKKGSVKASNTRNAEDPEDDVEDDDEELDGFTEESSDDDEGGGRGGAVSDED